MSKNWTQDIAEMHEHYRVNQIIRTFDKEKIKAFLEFRRKFLFEEYLELSNAIDNEDAEEIVDALIDLCVVAIGTLDALEVNSEKAWDSVLKANMNKKVGIKESRPNPLGLPDLIKPEGWKGPSHKNNHGLLYMLGE